MPIYVTPAQDVPIPAVLNTPISFSSQYEKAKFAVNALKRLVDMGATIGEDGEIEVKTTDEAAATATIRATELLTGVTSLQPRDYANPTLLLKLTSMLNEYDKEVIRDANQLRRYIKNKILEETGDSDPKIRLRALELLGKTTDVGLFSEKSEVTVKHGTTEELEVLLKKRLERLIDLDKTDYIDVSP